MGNRAFLVLSGVTISALVSRIYGQGGNYPDDIIAFHTISGCPPAPLPANPADGIASRNVFLQAEQCGAAVYHICTPDE